MEKTMMRKMFGFLVLSAVSCLITSFNKPLDNHKPPKLHTIIIDPGHGGFDPGTHGLISKEKDVTLAISLKLGRAIQEAYPDIKVVYTRTTDIMPGNKPNLQEGIRYRAELANRAHGDLFICIHCNSNGQPAGQYPVQELTGYKTVGKGKKKKKVPVYTTRWFTNTKTGTATYIWKADRN